MIACTIHEIAKKQAEKQKEKLVLRPGFEPGSSARKAEILNRTIFGRDFRLFYRSPCQSIMQDIGSLG